MHPTSLLRIGKRIAAIVLALFLFLQLSKSTKKLLTSPDVAEEKLKIKASQEPVKGKLLDYKNVTLMPWKPRASFSDHPQVTYLNGHRGCNENMHGIMMHLKLNFKVLNPRKVARYGMTEAEAKELINSGFISSLCNQSDVIIVADTLPDARGLLLSLLDPDESKRCKSNIIVESTNRFNWMVDDHREYNQMLLNLTENPPRNLFWTANNPFEEVYFRMRVGKSPKFTLLRSLGAWNVDPSNNPQNMTSVNPKLKAKTTDPSKSIAFINNVDPDRHPKVLQLLKLHQHLDKHLTLLPKHYGGPHTLLQYKGFLDFPYQVSVMKFYENIAFGVPQLLPTPRFLKAIAKDAGYHHLFSHWLNKLEEASVFLKDPAKHAQLFEKGAFKSTDEEDADDQRHFTKLDGHYTASWTELSDFYSHEFEPFIYYFDSFKELKKMMDTPFEEFDFMSVRVEGPKYYAKVRNHSLETWTELFRGLGYNNK
ncbi:UNVERIFIED_CONTAM: hypothetical protein HDU68_007375 [Siphonaria sp. JEL0065]|nr:hypothetical protein HDU68_007375 [Siphonaria sp. JEL0065]